MSETGTLDLDRMEVHAGEAERLLKAVSNRHRLMILCLLHEGERSVGDLHERLPLSQSALSQHLAVLRREGFVRTRRDAQTIFYSLTSPRVAAIIHTLYTIYCEEPAGDS